MPKMIGYNPEYVAYNAEVYTLDTHGRSHEFPMWEKLYLKIIQALLDALSVFVVYLMLVRFVDKRKALATALMLGCFTAFLGVYALLLRETLQLFLMLLLSYWMIRYYDSRHVKHIIGGGIVSGLLTLTLQANALIVPLYCAYIIMLNIRATRKLLWHTFLYGGLAILIVTPWLVRSYSYFEDIRVLRSMGMSLTFEQLSYIGSLGRAVKRNAITQEKQKELGFINNSLSQKDMIKHSLNGGYLRMADSLDALAGTSASDKARTPKNLTHRINRYLRGLIYYVTPRISFGGMYSMVKTYLFALLALLGVPVILKYFLKLRFIWPLLVFHLFMALRFGDESRRLIFMHYLVATFASITILYAYEKLRKRNIRESSQAVN